MASVCNLPVVAEDKEELRVEPPAAEQPPRSVGFLISQLGFFSSKGFMEALEPVGIDPREFLLMRFVAATEGQSQQALAERLAVPASRMVALVDHLEEAARRETAEPGGPAHPRTAPHKEGPRGARAGRKDRHRL